MTTHETDLSTRVRQIVDEYLEAFKSVGSELDELDSTEREELLGVIQDETGILLERRDFDALVDKDDLTVEDIADALEHGTSDEDLDDF